MHKFILVFICSLLISQNSFGQLALFPIEKSKITVDQRESKLHKKTSLIQLPFFDDFYHDFRSLNPLFWEQTGALANADLPVNAPSYNAVVLDHLDRNGVPYSTLNKNGFTTGDTLLSACINLKNKGISDYEISDSIYLSFFYQAVGRGFDRNGKDSIVLYFKDTSKEWNRIWSKTNSKLSDFKQVIIPIVNKKYFSDSFQFRFILFTEPWGNTNHWLLDYFYINSNRSLNNTSYDDYSIQYKPSSVLKNYSSMPYNHFLEDQNNLKNDSIYFIINNLLDRARNMEVRYQTTANGSQIASTDFSTNALNINAQSNSLRKVNSFNFPSLTGKVILDREYFLRDAGIINEFNTDNDVLRTTQIFDDYYAYDDGTPEMGFGFRDLLNREGEMAIRFDLAKEDSLYGIDIHLTDEVSGSGFNSFKLRVWQEIEVGSAESNFIYESEPITAADLKEDSVYGFFHFDLDTVLYLPKGTFYIGWIQEADFNLNVGYDQNYGYIFPYNQTNSNIFYKTIGSWVQNNSSAFNGAPMIRAVVGNKRVPTASNKPLANNHLFNIYPNPTSKLLFIDHWQQIESLKIISQDGKTISNFKILENSIDISHLPNGLYWLILQSNKQSYLKTFIKQ